MIVAEGERLVSFQPVVELLQWGRNMIVAEGRRALTTVLRQHAPFNGAAT